MEQLVRIQSLYAHCLKTGVLSDSMPDAHVVLLLKPGKNLQSCTSYGPIALPNMDLKIFTSLPSFISKTMECHHLAGLH